MPADALYNEDDAPVEEPAPVQAVEPMVIVPPLDGETAAVFSVKQLAYDATLGDWRTHDGIDIRAEAGTAVVSASALLHGSVVLVIERVGLHWLLVRLLRLRYGPDHGLFHGNGGVLDDGLRGLWVRDGDALSGRGVRRGAGNGVILGLEIVFQQGEIANHSGCDHADEQGYVEAHAAEDGGSLPLASVVHRNSSFHHPAALGAAAVLEDRASSPIVRQGRGFYAGEMERS